MSGSNRRIFADVIVYIFAQLAYDLPNRSSGRIGKSLLMSLFTVFTRV